MKRYYMMFIISMVLFASNGIIAAHINLSSYEIVLTRTSLGSLLLIVLLLIKRQRITFKGKGRAWLFLAASSFAMGGNWLFLYEAFQQIGVSLAMLACYCGPVLVIAVSPFLFHERITLVKMAGLCSVILGMFFVNGANVQVNGFSWGLFCGIMSGVCFALLIILNKLAKGVSGLQNTASQLIGACILVGAFTLSFHSGPINLDLESYVAMFVLGVINTGGGCYLYFTGMQHMPAQSVSICGYLEPFLALVFAAIFLNETLTIMQTIGAVLIIGGVAFSELVHKNYSN